MLRKFVLNSCLVFLLSVSVLLAGPYSGGMNDFGNDWDAPVPGFVGPGGDGRSGSVVNFVNPLFFYWADQVVLYEPAPGVAATWGDPTRALGPVTGNSFSIVSLGELDAGQIAAGVEPGRIVLGFPKPIRNFSGADFVVFENGFISGGGAGVAGQLFAELAYVEVSSNGVDFVRFPSHSLISEPVGAYGTIDPSDVYNLAGKHANASGDSWGTPFYLEDLEGEPLVLEGKVDLDSILWVRLVDIPGNGFFRDSFGNPIYDAWPTFGSGGFDLEAVGVISVEMSYPEWVGLMGLDGAMAAPEADPAGDGVPNLLRYAFGRHPGEPFYVPGVYGFSVGGTEGEGAVRLDFVRDERLTDLVYEVEYSENLRDWHVVAESRRGGVFDGSGNVEIMEKPAGPVKSVGVLRQVSVRVPSGGERGFLRLKVSLLENE